MSSDNAWLIGVGRADVTGDPWNVGMMGYGMRFQRTAGLHLRQRARAFVIVDPSSGNRVAYVVADIGMFFRNVKEAVLARLDPSLYRADNVVLTATHTHAGVGGYSCYRLYNMTTDGFQRRTFDAIVDGVVAAIQQATADAAPGRLVLARGELHDASVNRSPQSFDRNPADDRAAFPDRIDPTTTLLRLERQGRVVGVINWFATHGTSLSNRNLLISGDNKGYAAYRWERDEPLVAAFAQTNAGDMSPNVPDATRGPTDNDVDNARIIGERQLDAALALARTTGTEVTGTVTTALRHVRLEHLDVAASWCSDGRPHRTGRAVLGAAFAAGTKEGPGVSFCHAGVDANKLLDLAGGALGRVMPTLGDAQLPKAMLLPVGLLGWTADVLPIQLVRIGALVLVAVAQEVTIVAGLRLRRLVAAALGVDVEDVLVQGYANDYAGYLTTPEEYGEQRYEGGHTMFGRWQLPAYLQEVSRLVQDMQEGRVAGDPHAPPAARTRRTARARLRKEQPVAIGQPASSCSPGDVARATVRVDDPRGPLRPNYFSVQRQTGEEWQAVTDDADWATTIEWHASAGGAWTATMTWTVPQVSGTFRFAYTDGSSETSTSEFVVH
ncbi:MAG TPA: neutral/alkaline non-lysosomal ceramidase N-terminal domain-containing protein [Mycobacteriales bacterium]|nr:neutral/alkaline non-lysosomal ceramidase N-terminal domain-containing protein [Mycobacteriales bacterium]